MSCTAPAKQQFFTDLIKSMEGEAQKSEAAANVACERVNFVRSDTPHAAQY